MECPICQGAMFDNRESKNNPKAPDYRCKDRNCTGLIWPPKRAGKPQKAPPEPIEAGPYVPGLDGPQQPIATKPVLPLAIHPDDVRLLAECLEAGVRAVRYAAKQLEAGEDIVFTGDNVCSIASTLYIGTQRRAGR